MIVQDDNGNITISYGDTFAVKFELSKALKTTDKAVLSIYDGEDYVMKQEKNGDGTNEVKFVISATNMASLSEGTYTYDMHIDFADGRVFTTDWKRKLKLKGVAHDVSNH